MLNAERYILVKEIFLAASSRSPEERLSFLDEVCGTDLELRTEVESLLSFDDSAEEFMETPVFQGAPALHTSDIFATRRLDFGPVNVPPRPRPTRIGAYAILDDLGEGGMGVVYLAEQDSPRRLVALKVIKPGLATNDVLRRFEFEAQLLGRLQHPGIAQIFEAGTFDDGDGARPFYAMEYIEGQPLSKYIEQNNLDVRQRLALLVKVCEAVHHAHQKGIIHRDLKPGNVLVTSHATSAHPWPSGGITGANAMPKILDFGVARAISADDRHTIQTGAGQLIGTISYMSPEQVSGNPDDLDTRSDVYALGVMGFEMLARALPHDFGRKAIAECARIIRDEDPRKLGEFDKSFRGDLETIFAKALEKDQTRRYQSASDLAADLRHFLNHEPIGARPATLAYKVRKQIERNPKTASIGAILSAVAIVAVLVMAWVWWAKAASDQYAGANKAAFKAIEESYYAALQTGDFDRHRASTLETMLVKMDALAADTERRSPRKSIELYLSVAEGYRRLGMYGDEQSAAEHALALRQRISSRRDKELAEALHEMGKALWWNCDYSAAEQRYAESLEIRRRLFGDRSEPVATSLTHLAACAMRLGRLDRAEEVYRQVLEMRQGFPDSPSKNLMIGASLHNLAAVIYTQGRYQEALDLYEKDMALTGDPDIDRERLPRGLCNTAEALIDLSRFDEADKALSQAMAIQEDHGLNQSLTARILYQQGRLLYRQGRAPEAEARLREALDKLDNVLVADHLAIADTQLLLGRVLLANGDIDGAEDSISQALAIRDQRLPAEHWLIADAQSALGEVEMAQGHFEEAEPLLLQAQGRLAAARLPGDPYLTDSVSRLIRLYEQTNREDAAQWWRAEQ